MKRKVGRPKKIRELEVTEHVQEEEKTHEVVGNVLEESIPVSKPVLETGEKTHTKIVEQRKPENREFKEKPDAPISERIADSRKSLDQILPPGMAFFESPEGEILIGEDSTEQMWSRTMNKGKGGWANKRR